MKGNSILFPLIGIVLLSAGMIVNGGSRETVVCFGDSITHGAKVNGHSWVYLLSKPHKNFRFVNEGRNGRKTSDREELLPVLKEYNSAGMFLIFLGVNDLKDGNDSMVNSCVENMKWMILRIRENCPGAKIVMLAPCRINVETMSALNIGKKYNMNTEKSLVRLDKRYKALAREESVGFISLLNAVSPENYADGLHPDSAGQQEIAETVWNGLSRLVSRQNRLSR